MRNSTMPGRGVAAAAVLAVLGCATPEPSADLAARRVAVAAAGSQVMPFDLDATVHVFETTEFGGIQQVVADTGDSRQVALIREHLEAEAGRFARGDFHDPAMVHGPEMAGLHRLVMGHERLSIEYGEIGRGAEIVYRSKDPSLVAAIHAWFDAQLRDHGEHARAQRR